MYEWQDMPFCLLRQPTSSCRRHVGQVFVLAKEFNEFRLVNLAHKIR